MDKNIQKLSFRMTKKYKNIQKFVIPNAGVNLPQLSNVMFRFLWNDKKRIKICRNLSFRNNPDANLSMSSLILCLDSYGMTKKRIKIYRNLSFRRNPDANLSMSSLILCLDSYGMTNQTYKQKIFRSCHSVGIQTRIFP